MSVPSLGNCVPQAHGSGDFTFPLFSGHPPAQSWHTRPDPVFSTCSWEGQSGLQGKGAGALKWKETKAPRSEASGCQCLLSPSLGSASSLCTAIAEAAAWALQANSGGLWKARMGWFMSVKLTLCLCPHYRQRVRPWKFMAWPITQLERPLDLRDSLGSGPFRSTGKQPWVCGSSSSAQA